MSTETGGCFAEPTAGLAALSFLSLQENNSSDVINMASLKKDFDVFTSVY
jgi:hypothetical protein